MLHDCGTGWADWEFDNFRDRISYIDDFPFNVLEALISYFETGRSSMSNSMQKDGSILSNSHPMLELERE